MNNRFQNIFQKNVSTVIESADTVIGSIVRPKTKSIEAHDEEIRNFCTDERLKAAKPFHSKLSNLPNRTMSGYRNVSIGSPLNVPGAIPSINSTISTFSTKTDRQVFRTGRHFWHYGIDLWCSAAVVTSSSQDLIVAAAHCV